MSESPQLQRKTAYMACASVDMAALGKSARLISDANPFLSAMLFKLLGLNCILTSAMDKAFTTRKLDTARETKSLNLYLHIIWLAREGLAIIEDFVLPMVEGIQVHRWEQHRPQEQPIIDTDMAVLKIISYKLKAIFLNVYCLFHNTPAVTRITTPPELRSSRHRSIDKGKQRATDDPSPDSSTIDRSNTFTPSQLSASSIQATHPIEYGAPFPYDGAVYDSSYTRQPTSPATFLLPLRNHIPDTMLAYLDVVQLVDTMLMGSHPVRLSTKLSYARFLWDCCAAVTVADGKIEWRSSTESSDEVTPRGRDGKTEAENICLRTIREVYKTTEGIDDEMFADSARFVNILAEMGQQASKRPANTTGDAATRVSDIGSSSEEHGRSQSTTSPVPAWSVDEQENGPVYYRNQSAHHGGDAANDSRAFKAEIPGKPGRGARLGQMIHATRYQGTQNEGGQTELPSTPMRRSIVTEASRRQRAATTSGSPKKTSTKSPMEKQISGRKVLSPIVPVGNIPGIIPKTIGGMVFGDQRLGQVGRDAGGIQGNMI